MGWPESLRERICGACQWPCAERKAGTLDLARAEMACPIGRWHAWQEAQGAPSPLPSKPLNPAPRIPISPRLDSMEKLGPRLWAELHRRPWACELSVEAGWLEREFAPKLMGCACRSHWRSALLHG